MTLSERFWYYVRKTPTCWEWTGAKREGYGRFRVGTRVVQAHRFAYEELIGPIWFELDHKCRNPSCVNPDHLEDVSHQTNIQRGINGLARPVCPAGHSYKEFGKIYADGKTRCTICRRGKARAIYNNKRKVTE